MVQDAEGGSGRGPTHGQGRRGEFLVLVRCRGELAAERSIQLTAPVRVSDLQIVWLAPPNSPVTQGQNRKSASIQRGPAGHSGTYRRTAPGRKRTWSRPWRKRASRPSRNKLDTATSQYDLEKARLAHRSKPIMSEIQGEESKIDARVAEEKLHVEQAAVELHQKSAEAKIASLARLRDQEQAGTGHRQPPGSADGSKGAG